MERGSEQLSLSTCSNVSHVTLAERESFLWFFTESVCEKTRPRVDGNYNAPLLKSSSRPNDEESMTMKSKGSRDARGSPSGHDDWSDGCGLSVIILITVRRTGLMRSAVPYCYGVWVLLLCRQAGTDHYCSGEDPSSTQYVYSKSTNSHYLSSIHNRYRVACTLYYSFFYFVLFFF